MLAAAEATHSLPALPARRNGASSHSSLTAHSVDPLSDRAWDALVLSHPEHSFFHSSAWARVLSTTYGHQPLYLRFAADSETVALLPLLEVASRLTGRRGVCLPFSDFCGPLLFEGSNHNTLLAKLVELGRERRWKHFEIRQEVPLPGCGAPFTRFYSHTLDLRAGPDEVFSQMAGSSRGAIRKAVKAGLTAKVEATAQAVADFYRLHIRTRRRHGAPPQSFSFFRNIYENVIAPGLGFVVVVRDRLQPVAAAVFFHFGRKAIYKFAASDAQSQHSCGNNLVMWQAINQLSEDGCETLHFGRTELGNEGLRNFKRSWGAAEQMAGYSRFDLRGNAWVAPRSRQSSHLQPFAQRLPLFVNRMAGAALYPHLD